MLFAYTMSGEMTLSSEIIDEIHQAVEAVERECPAGGPLPFDWDCLVPDSEACGTFLRGYRHVESRETTLAIVECLRLLSAKLPACTLYLSGGADLPMTQIEEGEFQLFAEVYEAALAAHTVEISAKRRSASNT